MTAFSFVVSESESGQRLDRLLVARVEGLSRARAAKLTADGMVRVDGRRARKGTSVTAGQVIELEEVPEPIDFAAEADPELPLVVVHEDPDVVVIDKPAGTPSHPLRPHERGTVAGALVARYPEMAGVGYSPREPGILHRLDTDTSGLLIAARTEEAFTTLRTALREGRIDKRYIALCAGRLGAPRRIDLPLATDPSDKRRVMACLLERDVTRLRARPAETEITESELLGTMSLVHVRAHRATRHQIRAHLAALGHALAGDELYGGPAMDGLSRHFLHASEVHVTHPRSGQSLSLRSELPPELAGVLAGLQDRG